MGKSFAERLREYRGDKSQLKTATQLDISPSYYGELERGTKEPSFKVLNKVVLNSGKDFSFWFDTDSSKQQPEISSSRKDIAKIDDLTPSEIIVLLAQIRVYLEKTDLLATDRRMISEILSSCQRTLEGNIETEKYRVS